MIKVKRNKDGEVFTSDMSDSNKKTITEIHFCTSYTQVLVQEQIDGKFKKSDIICPPIGTEPNPIDLIATQYDDYGELID